MFSKKERKKAAGRARLGLAHMLDARLTLRYLVHDEMNGGKENTSVVTSKKGPSAGSRFVCNHFSDVSLNFPSLHLIFSLIFPT